jgi:hypothetical protein
VGPILIASKFLEREARRDPNFVASDRSGSTVLVARSASLKTRR